MVWMLFVTHTTISVPALIGAIMCLGVATANSILIVSFARERMDAGLSAMAAALEAGFVRFRPVLMTALAMIIGMLPMSLGLRRRRRAERAAGTSGHRRSAVRHVRDPAVRAGGVCRHSRQIHPASPRRHSDASLNMTAQND